MDTLPLPFGALETIFVFCCSFKNVEYYPQNGHNVGNNQHLHEIRLIGKQHLFTIILQRPQKNTEVNEKTVEKTVEKTIIDLIKVNPKSTTKTMMVATGLTRRGVEYQLNKLKELGKIERIGPDRGGYWKVN
jgi:predicted HTH transcriptional regulator